MRARDSGVSSWTATKRVDIFCNGFAARLDDLCNYLVYDACFGVFSIVSTPKSEPSWLNSLSTALSQSHNSNRTVQPEHETRMVGAGLSGSSNADL